MNDSTDGLTTLTMEAREAHLAPFVPPELGRFEVLRLCLLVVRIALTIWAFTLGAIAAQAADDVRELDQAVRLLTIVVIVLGILWFGLGAAWAVLRTRNIHRLDGRYPTRARAARVWVYAPVWIALMSATLVQLEPNPEFDVRPSIIVVGFVVTMFAVYRLVQRLFKSLVRARPDGPTFVLFIVDLIGFGLIWWRLATWPEREVDISSGTVDLLTSASFAAAIALLVGLLSAVYLDLELDRSEDIRLLALRTRHDHRVARLQGLDPLDGATRWALWTARHVGDRASPAMAPTAVREPVASPTASAAPPAPSTLRPTRSEPSPPLVVPTDPEQVPVELALDPGGVARAPSPEHPAPEPAAPAEHPAPPAQVLSAPAASAQVADDALVRALRRQSAETQRRAGRERGRALADWGGDRRSDPELTGEAVDLARGISAELDSGGGPSFADRVRALSEQYVPTPGWPGTAEPTTMLSGQPARPAPTPGALANRPKPPRLLLLEIARFTALLALLAGAIAAGWMLVGVSRYGAPGAVLDFDGLEAARTIIVYAFTASSVLALWWAWLAARHASRVESTLSHVPFAILAGLVTVVAGAAAAVEAGAAGPLGLAAMIVAAGALLVGLRLLLPVVDTFGLRFRTFNAWLFDVVAVVVFLLASPLGSEIEDGVDGGRIAFGVILVGLGLAVGAALASLATEELEGALKGSSELARLNEPTPARSPGTPGSSPPPSGPRRSG